MPAPSLAAASEQKFDGSHKGAGRALSPARKESRMGPNRRQKHFLNASRDPAFLEND